MWGLEGQKKKNAENCFNQQNVGIFMGVRADLWSLSWQTFYFLGELVGLWEKFCTTVVHMGL